MKNNWVSNLDSIPVGLYEKALPKDLSWEERLQLTRETGFDFLEISIDDSDDRIARLDWTSSQRRGIKQSIEKSGVRIQSLSLSAHRRFPLGSKSTLTRERSLDIFKKAIDLAVDLGIRVILVPGANNYYDESDSESLQWYAENLGRGLRWASGAGVMLALENWDIQINTLTKTMEYIRYFNSPWFQVYPDIGNLIFAEVDIISQLDEVKGHIAALHVKDTLPGQLRYVAPGEGKVPFRDAFEKLAEIGFQAPVVLELWTEEFPNAVELVTEAGQYIRAQMKAGWESFQARENN